MAYRLYVPEAWANDPDRRHKADVPEKVTFQAKPQIALQHIRAARDSGIPSAVVLSDAGYGVDTSFRDGITALGLPYVAAIMQQSWNKSFDYRDDG